jgi:hypothetical protein
MNLPKAKTKKWFSKKMINKFKALLMVLILVVEKSKNMTKINLGINKMISLMMSKSQLK